MWEALGVRAVDVPGTVGKRGRPRRERVLAAQRRGIGRPAGWTAIRLNQA
jgi:hypothetical protein